MFFFVTELVPDTVAFVPVWVAVVVVFAVVFDVPSFAVVTDFWIVAGSVVAVGSGLLLGSTKNLKWFQHFPCWWWTMT